MSGKDYERWLLLPFLHSTPTYLTYTQRRLDPNAGYTGYTTAKGEKEAVAVNEAAKASRFD